jgi:hypothetical protein
MKKTGYLVLFVALILSVIVTGCSKNSPKQVAQTWLNGFHHLDFDAAKKVSTEDTKKMLSQFEQLTSMLADSNKKELKKVVVTIKDIKEDGDKAVATYVTSDNPGKDQTINLVKQDGQWLVQFTKVDMETSAAKDIENEPVEAEPADSTAAPADTATSTKTP